MAKNIASVSGMKMAMMPASPGSVRYMAMMLPITMMMDWTIINIPMRTNMRTVLTSEFSRTINSPVRQWSRFSKLKLMTLRYRALRIS